MKIFENIIGQPHVTAILQDAVNAAHNSIESQKMSHSWLFTGPPGSGRSIAAATFAAALVCSINGCGSCVDCETAQNGSHVDVEILKTEGLSIKIDEIRELISRATWTPSLSVWRIMILEDADRLTEAAANALLKAIEEPTSRTVWLLCAPSAIDVLPTIHSRCRLLVLNTPPHETIVKLLIERDGIVPELADYSSRISQGHIGRAKYLSRNPESRNHRNQVLNLVFNTKDKADAFKFAAELIRICTEEAQFENEEVKEKELTELKSIYQGTGRALSAGGSKAIKEFEKEKKSRQTRHIREAIENALLDLASLYRDVMLVQNSAHSAIINQDLSDRINSLAASKSPHQILVILNLLMQTRSALLQNGSSLLLLEDLASSIL